MSVKIEEYIKSLPDDIISGNEVQLPADSLRKIFEFLNLDESDIFYHLGCGDGEGIKIALQEFHVKNAIGIDNDKEKIQRAKQLAEKNQLNDAKFFCDDVITAKIDDATAILLWFTDTEIVEKMKKRFQSLKSGCRIVTIWGPLPAVSYTHLTLPTILLV